MCVSVCPLDSKLWKGKALAYLFLNSQKLTYDRDILGGQQMFVKEVT